MDVTMYPFSTALFSSSVVHVPVRDHSWGECGLWWLIVIIAKPAGDASLI